MRMYMLTRVMCRTPAKESKPRDIVDHTRQLWREGLKSSSGGDKDSDDVRKRRRDRDDDPVKIIDLCIDILVYIYTDPV